MVREQRAHLLLALEVLLLGVVQAVFLVDKLAGIQADQPVMGGTVLLVHEVHVIGSHHLDPVFLGQFEDHRDIFPLAFPDVQAESRDLGLVVHDLEVVVLAEDMLVPFYGTVNRLHVPVQDAAGDLTGHAGGAADQVLVVFLDDFVAHAGLAVVHALDVAGRDNLHQVLVPVVVLGQEDEMVVLAVGVVLELVVIVLGDIDLAADDGLDRRVLLGEFVELLDAVHVAMVRDGQAGHSHFLGAVEQVLDGRHAVEDGVLRMDVKVYEGHITKVRK